MGPLNPMLAGSEHSGCGDHILVDRDAESQRDLLGNAGTTPAGIMLFRCHNGRDEVLVRLWSAKSLSRI